MARHACAATMKRCAKPGATSVFLATFVLLLV
jgi:hypothetical protein